MATRRHSTAEFKLEVIKMVIDQGIAISKLSKYLSIGDNLIRRWVKQYQLKQNGSVLQGTTPLHSTLNYLFPNAFEASKKAETI